MAKSQGGEIAQASPPPPRHPDPNSFEGFDADNITAPLAVYNGASPDAPSWFQQAIETLPERHQITVQDTIIEWLSWGDKSKPGLLLLHGNAAHADWWRFIAPFFTDTHHVITLSWSGMGNSGHRSSYHMDHFLSEIRAVTAAAGFDKIGPYDVVGHSFGGFPMMAMANQADCPFRQAIILDTPFDLTQRRRPRGDGGDARPHKIYPTQAEALARFRWSPLQPTLNPFITDFIARHSMKAVDGGYSWKFDPYLWSEFEVAKERDMLLAPNCPISLIWGEKSALLTPKLVADMANRMPKSSKFVPIPEAYHHVMADQPLALVSALRALLA